MRALAAVVATLLPLAIAATAIAEGPEAGLVVDYGSGRVETVCVAFEGDSIAGDELLARAGFDVNAFSGLVCAIGETGCEHSGSFDSCTCECRSGGDGCVYWAFFSRSRDEAGWRYSSLGLRALEAESGDLQGWRWGSGAPGAAPAPPPLSFEDVCGGVTPAAEAPGATPPPAQEAAAAPVASTPAPAAVSDAQAKDGGARWRPLVIGAMGSALAIGALGGWWRWRRRGG